MVVLKELACAVAGIVNAGDDEIAEREWTDVKLVLPCYATLFNTCVL
jgi:hypothetical protein